MKDKAPTGTQYLDLASAIAIETCHYLQGGELTSEQFQRLIGDKEKIRQIAVQNAHEMLKLVPEEVVQAKTLLEKFFLEIFDFKVNLTKVAFPKRDGMSVFMYNPRKWSEDQIAEVIKNKWGVLFVFDECPNSISKGIDRAKEQPRPKGSYVFCHTGGDESDTKHRDKSYKGMTESGVAFANIEEYLLMQAFHKFSTNKFMNTQGWVRTSSLWSNGYLVTACLLYGYKLTFFSGGLEHIGLSNGPREIFF